MLSRGLTSADSPAHRQDLVAVSGLSEVCGQPRIDIGSAFRALSMAAIWSGETRFIGERG